MSHNQMSNDSLGLLARGLEDIEGLLELFLTHNDLSLPNGILILKALANKM